MRLKRIFPIIHVIHGLMTTVILIVLATDLGTPTPSAKIQPAPDLGHLKQRLDTSAQTLAQVNSTLAQLEDKLARLESTQSQLSTAIRKQQSPAQTLVAHADEQSAESPSQTEDSFELPPPKQGFDAERLPFSAEPFDADWSLATEASVLTALTKFDILDIELDTAKCYQRGCQLEFKHLSNENNGLLLERLQSSELFGGEFFARTIVDDDGATRTIMMIGRADDSIVDEVAF